MEDPGEDAGVKLFYLHAPGTERDDPQTLAATGSALVKQLPAGVTALADLGVEVTALLIPCGSFWAWAPMSPDIWRECGLGSEPGPFHVCVRDLNPGQSLQQQKHAAPDHDLLARAFRYEFRNPANAHILFDALSSICVTGNSYARAAGIFQSSGWGKSRTVCELLIPCGSFWGWTPMSPDIWRECGFGSAPGPFHVRVRDLNPGQSLQQQKHAAPDHDLLARAFRYEFRNPANAHILFDALSSICHTHNSYARAAGIFQSSGWGKSRTVCELWRHKVWVIYLSFAGGTGYPRASSIKDWFLQQVDQCLRKPFMLGQLECMTFSLAYFVACLGELNSLIRQQQVTQQDFAAMLSTGLEGAKKFWDHVQQKMMQLLCEYKDLPTIAARHQKPSDAWANWTADASYLLRNATAGFKQAGQSFSVLFVYDEARHLLSKDTGNPHLNSFIPIRRSAQAMSAHGVGMLLFMDTSSQVSSFADKVWADPSDRVAKAALNLAPPIWACFSADVSQEDWELFFPSTRMFQDIIRPAWYVRYGRPLWWAQFRSYRERRDSNSYMEGSDSSVQRKQDDDRTDWAFRLVYTFARDKLLGGGGAWNKYFVGNKEEKLSTEAALSLLGVRVAFDVDPRCRLASSMVANNLLSVVSVSPSREHLWTAWNVEPLVAQVAADVINTLHKDGRSEELYGKLVGALVAGWIDKGYAGELVARIILLYAVDKAMGGRMYCSVGDFCKSLVKQNVSLSSLPNSLSAARLHFNAFRRIFKNADELTFNDFREAFERGYAIICSLGAWGVDLYIVAFCGNDDEELTEQNTTLIHGQVKLREEISPQFAGLKVMKNLPYLSLYMNVMHKEDASCKVVSRREIENSVTSSKTKPITYALEELRRQGSAPDGHVSKKPKQRNNDKAMDAWVKWLTAESDMQTVLAIKGLNAFDLNEDLKRMLKTIVEASKQIFMEGEASCRELMRLQREHLPNMFPHLNIGNYK